MHIILIFLLITNIVTVYLLMQGSGTGSASEFELLSPQIAKLGVDEFLEKQDALSASYYELRNSINSTIIKGNDNYGFYMEDLITGAWIGINEKGNFMPASLIKVPVAVGVMKKVQDGDMSLDDEWTLIESDIDYSFGDLCEKGAGYTTTIGNLVELSLKESDNTANTALSRTLTTKNLQEAVIACGLHLPNSSTSSLYITPKEYSNVFRSLYFSTYLRRPFSEFVLSEMINTSYENFVAGGLPSSVKFSHKIGEIDYGNGEIFLHDCGIVYLPKKPYFICIMTNNVQKEEVEETMSRISKTVFEYMKI
jgi:beta-lactamase class A